MGENQNEIKFSFNNPDTELTSRQIVELLAVHYSVDTFRNEQDTDMYTT